MRALQFWIMFFALICLPCGAFASNDGKLIYYYIGCDNPEINSDIEVSISGIVNYAKKNNIHLIELDKPKKCGYLLVCGEKKKQIRSAVTDVDLLLLSNKFFGLDSPGNAMSCQH